MFEEFAVPQWFAWIVVLVAALYWYITRNHSYWKKVGIPYAKPWPLVGSMNFNFKKPVHLKEEERYKKYGTIYGHYEGNRPILNIAEPELLRDILLKDFQAFFDMRFRNVVDPLTKNMLGFLQAEDWKRIRSIISPTFSTGKIKRVFGIVEDCANTLCKNFLKAANEGKDFNAKELFGAFAMDVIASTAFSTKLDSHNDPKNRFVQMAKGGFSGEVNWRIILIAFAPSVARMLGVNILQTDTINFFRDLTVQIIKERKEGGEKRNDFLQLLMDAHKDSEVDQKQENAEKDIDSNYLNEGGGDLIINSSYRKKALSENELLAQCVGFFLGGYETTATVLSFISYELASHPEIQEKVIEEIDRSLRDNQGILSYETIQRMQYLDNVISETLRMYPPAPRLERMSSQEYTLGNTGITIPKGTVVNFPVYAIHRDPKYYPNPGKFDPDRFSKEVRDKRPAYTYLPFGGGPRNCAAMRFALLEMKICLATVLSRFRVKVSPKMKLPLEFKITAFLLQPKELLLQLEVRNDAQPIEMSVG